MSEGQQEDCGEDAGGATGDVAVIGEQSRSSQVSLQTLQGIYNELTGKTEEVGKSYEIPLQATFEDFHQLDHFLHQACEQYNIAASNCSITSYYMDGARDTFSSFDRFRLHSQNSNAPIESVLLKYNFLILLPKTRKPQPYTLTVRVASRVAVVKKIRDEHGYMGPTALFRLFGNRIAVVEVQYVDYMVARNLLRIVDEWIHTIPAAPRVGWMRWLQARSHFVPRILQFLTAIFVSWLVISLIPKFVIPGDYDLFAAVNFSAVAMLGIYVSTKVAGFLGGQIEVALDSWSELSYLKITRGDEQEIKLASHANGWAAAKAVLAFVATIALNVIAKVIANVIV